MVGTVKVWSQDSDFGFLEVPGILGVVFLHKGDVIGGTRPHVGDRVEIGSVERTSRGLRCTGWIAILADGHDEESSDGK